MRFLPSFYILLLSASALFGQSRQHFDVATLKRSYPAGDSIMITLGTVQHGRTELANVTLSDCIKFAFGIVSDDLIAGPAWIKSNTVLFNIVGQSPPETTRDQATLMTQALLAERLKLTWHYEKKELRHLALVPGKGPVKMALADPAETPNNSGGKGHVTGNHVSMALLATLLSRMEHEVVVDETGLTGSYRIKLTWEPETGGAAIASSDDSRASLFTAVQEQLGLRLESRKGPLDQLVVDSADQTPADN